MNPNAGNSHSHLDHWFSNDIQFNLLYPPSIQMLAREHWTPLDVAKMACEFLVTGEGDHILDIGSGAGKFCLAASYYKPLAFFDGIEQRSNLVKHAETACDMLGLSNASFIHGNFTQIDLSRYDHFYFYNSFFENFEGPEKIDNSIEYSRGLYNYYTGYLYQELEKMPVGTRIVTYCSWQDEMPPSYSIQRSELNGLLKFNVKTL